MAIGKAFYRVVHPLVVLSYFAALAAFLVALALTYRGDLWVGPLGDVSSISVGSVAVIYALSQHRFSRAGYSQAKSVVLGVLFANAFLQCYEVVYGLTFGLAAALGDPPTLTGTDVRTFILWMVMISPMVVVHENLRFRRSSAALLALFAATWLLWILYGYPQYYFSGYSFAQVLKTSDPFHLSLWLNFGSKTVLAVFFVSLLDPLASLRAALGRR